MCIQYFITFLVTRISGRFPGPSHYYQAAYILLRDQALKAWSKEGTLAGRVFPLTLLHFTLL